MSATEVEHEEEDGVRGPGDLELDESLHNEPVSPEGLGAIGQLATAVVVVAVLLAAFIFGSAFLRRLFG